MRRGRRFGRTDGGESAGFDWVESAGGEGFMVADLRSVPCICKDELMVTAASSWSWSWSLSVFSTLNFTVSQCVNKCPIQRSTGLSSALSVSLLVVKQKNDGGGGKGEMCGSKL